MAAGSIDQLRTTVQRLEIISAQQHTLIRELLQRRVFGEGVTEAYDGWHITTTPQAQAGGFKLCIIRTLDLDPPIQRATAQLIGYADDSVPLEAGETYRHIIALDDEFEVFPAPSWNYEMLAMKFVSPREFVEGENLSNAMPWHVDDNNWVYPTMKFTPNTILVRPEDSIQSGGSVG